MYLQGSAQFVQNTTFGLWEKNDGSTLKNVLENTNEHTCDCLRYTTLLICLQRSVAWFWGVIRKLVFLLKSESNIGAFMWILQNF